MNERMRKLGAEGSAIRELFSYATKRKAEIGEENVFDFSLGNPSVAPPDAVVRGLYSLLSERDSTALHGYTPASGDAAVRTAIADSLNRKHGTSYRADELYLTCGAAASLSAALSGILNPGDEVIVIAPYFPEYRVFIEQAGGRVVECLANTETFTPDVEALCRAITPRTAAVIVNSPNNPSGSVIDKELLRSLCAMLTDSARKIGHAIYLISDEPYREIVYGDVQLPHVPDFYNNTVICYSYSKSLSLPGERIGYTLVPRSCDDAEALMEAVRGAGRSLGYVCAPSLFQHLLPLVDGEMSDVKIYEKNRNLLVRALAALGFHIAPADGAFYLFLKVPGGDAKAFSRAAMEEELMLVPSDSFGIGGYVRIAYCVKTEVVERSLAAFGRLRQKYPEDLYGGQAQ